MCHSISISYLNDLQKGSLLLHIAGMEMQEVYFMLLGEDTIATFQDTLKVLDDYFIPKATATKFSYFFFNCFSQKM